MGGPFLTRAFVLCCAIYFAHWSEALGAPGDLDPTFGTGGKVFVNFGGVCDDRALIVQPDGKIIAARQLRNGDSEQALIARFNVDGTLDASFGSGGKVHTFPRDSGLAIGGSMTMGRDGKIIALGTDFADFALARYETGIPVPQITSASIHGKNLTVLGTNFDAGAGILLNGVRQKTISDSANPGTTLIGVKVGRLIRPGDSIRVQSATGFLSPDFIFTVSARVTSKERIT